jgi:hypothetical protein
MSHIPINYIIYLLFINFLRSSPNLVLQSPLTISTPAIVSVYSSCAISTQGPITIFGSVLNGGIFYVNRAVDSGLNQIITIYGMLICCFFIKIFLIFIII